MKKVAIVGAEDSTRDNAPWNDQSFDIWLFNEWANHDWCKRWDAVLQLHKPQIYQSSENDKDPEHWMWLQKEHGHPIYMQKVDPGIPDSVEYPLEAINKEFLSTLTYKGIQAKNFRSTMSFAVALALFQNYEHIEVYGAEMEHSSEYKSQRANFSFWVGVATGRKVPVDMRCCKGLFDGSVYGYEDVGYRDRLYEYIAGFIEQKAEAEKLVAMNDAAQQFARQLLKDD